MEIGNWLDSVLSNSRKPRTLIDCHECTGLGDKIHITPALREYRRRNPDREIILLTDEFGAGNIFRGNPNIDYIIPHRIAEVKFNKAIDIFMPLSWSFYEHHQYDHIVASHFKYIVGDYGIDKFDYSTEMFTSENGRMNADLLFSQIPTNKPLMAVSAANTMFNRMWERDRWQDIVNRLIKKYTVVLFGSKNDFELENVFDIRGKLGINEVPYMLDKFDDCICLNNGFLVIAGCTKKVHIHFLNVGEFPSHLFTPVRNGELAWNCDVINHKCPIKDVCFEGHIGEDIFQKQYKVNKDKYRATYSDELIKKYTAWCYCAKDEDKYECRKMIYDKFLNYLRLIGV